jgi:hypothetical protein
MTAPTISVPGASETFRSLPNVHGAGQGLQENDEEYNGVTEIESLCMNCHDDVRKSVQPARNPTLTYF